MSCTSGLLTHVSLSAHNHVSGPPALAPMLSQLAGWLSVCVCICMCMCVCIRICVCVRECVSMCMYQVVSVCLVCVCVCVCAHLISAARALFLLSSSTPSHY